jgi:hypothetical protein
MAETVRLDGRNGESFRAGRGTGLAIAALALSAVSFLTLLGAEKAILAIVLAIFAARDAAPATLARRLAVGAVSLATVFLITLAVLLALYWDEAIELVRQLQKLS